MRRQTDWIEFGVTEEFTFCGEIQRGGDPAGRFCRALVRWRHRQIGDQPLHARRRGQKSEPCEGVRGPLAGERGASLAGLALPELGWHLPSVTLLAC